MLSPILRDLPLLPIELPRCGEPADTADGIPARDSDPRKHSHNDGARSPGRCLEALYRGLLGLAEAQRLPVALADRGELVAVDIAAAESRGQRPDAVRVVRRVLRVRVDLALAEELEARLLGERDEVVRAHVAGLRLRVLRLVVLGAVLLDAEDAARLQRGV